MGLTDSNNNSVPQVIQLGEQKVFNKELNTRTGQIINRVHKYGNESTSTTLYSVPAGKKFYISNICVHYYGADINCFFVLGAYLDAVSSIVLYKHHGIAEENVPYNFNYPIELRSGGSITFNVLGSNAEFDVTLSGWEEDLSQI